MNYKLNRIKKAGVAIGLAAILLLGSSGCSTNYSPYTSNDNEYSTSQTITNDYIDTLTSDELFVYDTDLQTTNIKLDNFTYMNFLNNLNEQDYSFRYADYYGLNETLNLYNKTIVNKQTTSTLLNSEGKLDAQKLMTQVQNNNNKLAQNKDAINVFYTDISTSDMQMICNLIAEVVNSKFNDIEISKMANTLMDLTMFVKEASAANAYITNNLTFVYNPSMTKNYGDIQELQGEASAAETLKGVITHEIMHIQQYSTSDRDDSNGIEAGIFRMYNVPGEETQVAVDSLWNTWLLEAAAELKMSEYLDIAPGTYDIQISYARSYNLSRFNELNLETQGIENIAFDSSLAEAYSNLELDTPEKQKEFLNFLYSIELTQVEPTDFWENYCNITETNPSEEEKLAIRMDIRTDAIKYLTRSFYNNLADSIYEGKVKDLDTVFYLMLNWELDIYGHLEYTLTSSFEHEKDFISWHDAIQTNLFQSIAESNNLTINEIKEQYQEYNLQANVDNQVFNNCNLSQYNNGTSNYIRTAKDNYTTRKFSRNAVVAEYIQQTSSQSTDDYYK